MLALEAQPILPNSHVPKQNCADSGASNINVNSTKVSDQMGHHVDVDPTLPRKELETRDSLNLFHNWNVWEM